MASVYSLPEGFFDAPEVRRFLTAIVEARPERELIVLSGQRPPGGQPASSRLHWIAGPQGQFTPWPRDPFLFGWRRSRPVLLNRPNAQKGRETDRGMAETLVRAWPAAFRGLWGAPELETASVPFHHGQILLAEGTLWLSMHSLEEAALRRLGLPGVPVDWLRDPGGRQAYLDALTATAEQLREALGARETRWVHAIPDAAAPGAAGEFLALAGGAGFDLDSYLTLLPLPRSPAETRRTHALVASLQMGSEELRVASVQELNETRRLYELAPAPEALRRRLLAAQEAARSQALGDYLDGVAEYLLASGLSVSRLPLLFVPTDLFEDRAGVDYPDFLLTWNNVVLDRPDGTPTAEGFRYHFGPGDRAAAGAFAAAGYRLDLLPPLRRSIVLGGGYRCASNHLRAPGQGQGPNSR